MSLSKTEIVYQAQGHCNVSAAIEKMNFPLSIHKISENIQNVSKFLSMQEKGTYINAEIKCMLSNVLAFILRQKRASSALFKALWLT